MVLTKRTSWTTLSSPLEYWKIKSNMRSIFKSWVGAEIWLCQVLENNGGKVHFQRRIPFEEFTACTIAITQCSCRKPSLKIWTANSICWNSLGLQVRSYFFRNKTFLFFKIESWNFQDLFEREFKVIQLIQIISFFLSIVWLSWNCVRFHKIIFQIDAENFSVLSWKTKKFYSLKKWAKSQG